MTSRHNARKQNTKRKVSKIKFIRTFNPALPSIDIRDICKNFLITDIKFRCTVTGKTFFIKCNLSCDTCNVIYLITCFDYREQYVGSAVNFKQGFRIQKSDIKTNKDHCGTAKHFNNK